jgi:hypothetical protein
MTASPSFEAIEDDRLRAHFEWVLAILRAQDTSPLADIAVRRAATIARLQAYAERGVFPRNTVSLEKRLPAFVDDRGVACAVADLMMGSGDDGVKLAGRIRDRFNLAGIGEMLGAMPDELGAWAESAGLSRVEMALIQPAYCGPDPQDSCEYWKTNTPGGHPGCPGPSACCEKGSREDGSICEMGSGSGVCTDGQCVANPKPQPEPKPEPKPETEPDETEPEDDGCSVALVDLGAGSIAPLFAAMALLAWRRKATRR